MSNDTTELDDRRVTSYPAWSPGCVVNATPFQRGGEAGVELCKGKDVSVVIMSVELDTVGLGKLQQILHYI